MRVLGLMSGTSLDAIDAAVVDIATQARTLRASLVSWSSFPWPTELRERIRGWSDPDAIVRLADVPAASMEIGAAMAAAAEQAATTAGEGLDAIDLVCSHGQTVQHVVDGDGRALATLQLGEPAAIAELTGRTVAADFRPRDISAGGQGAPLVSFVDALLFGEQERTVGVLNLGGMANVTLVPAGEPLAAIAFDTGPGNSLIDGVARRLLGEPMDRDGGIAAAGLPSAQLLDELLARPYFGRRPPKSTGRELFGDALVTWVAQRSGELHLTRQDVLATVTELTARSVADAIARWSPAPPSVVLVSGGGTRNPTLMRGLQRALARSIPSGAEAPQMRPVDDAGLPAQAKEAFTFAILGHEALHGRVNSIATATGARHPSILGAIWPGSDFPRLLGLVAGSRSAGQPIDRIVVDPSSDAGTHDRKGVPQ